jgi:hypothetical protein
VPEKKKTKVTYDKYISVVNLLVQRVNEDEMGTGEGVEGETLVEWYLEQKEADLAGEEDYHEEKALVAKIIKRMVKVRLFFPVTRESLANIAAGKYSHGNQRPRSHGRRRRGKFGCGGASCLCSAS